MANHKLKCLKQLEEFVKLVNEQLYRLDQIEEIELTRDWSSPHKLNFSSLQAHKKVSFSRNIAITNSPNATIVVQYILTSLKVHVMESKDRHDLSRI